MSNDPATLLGQLGVSGVTVGILLYMVRQLWADNKELREQARDDQKAVLPALEASRNALTEFARLAAQLLTSNNNRPKGGG